MARTPIKLLTELTEGMASQELPYNSSALKSSVSGGTIYLQDFDLVATPTGLVAADKGKVWKAAASPTGQWSTDGAANMLPIWTGSGWEYMDPQGSSPYGTFQAIVATAAASAHKGQLLGFHPGANDWFRVQESWTDYGSDVATEHWTGKWRNASKVYAKSVDFGALPNTTTKTIGHGITGLDVAAYKRAALLQGVASNGTNIIQLNGTYFVISLLQNVSVGLDATNISVISNGDVSGYSALFRLEYCKT